MPLIESQRGNSPDWPVTARVVACAIGAFSALSHLAEHAAGSSVSAIGQGILYAAPLALGVLGAMGDPKRPIRSTYLLCALSTVIAAPVMLGDLVCLITIIPAMALFGAISATLTSRLRAGGPPGTGAALLLLPFTWAVVDVWSPPALPPPRTLSDSVDVNMHRQALWETLDHLQLRFTRPAPWLVRLLLPMPVAIEGGGNRPGDQRRVIFDHGDAIGTVVTSEAPVRFTFRLETRARETAFFDHWILLNHSEIVLTDLGAGRTRVTHTTTYQPRAYPRWYFDPIERWLGGSLQAHMLQSYADVAAHDLPLVARK